MRRRGSGSASGSWQPYLGKRALELRTRTSRALTDPLAEWACSRIRLEGRPFSFAGHEFLRGIYDDTSHHVVLMKAAQIGGTTWAVLRSLHACLCGLNVVYYFPTKTDVHDFSRSRVAPLVDDNPFLAKEMSDVNAVGLKRVGEGFLYLRGMQSTVGLKSVPADMVVFDELDEATPEAKAMARERLAHSAYGRIIELSNPSLPGFGIDEAYQASDQRHWTLKCPGCSRWVALDKEFPDQLGKEVKIILPRPDGTFFRACPHCSHEVDLGAGEWVADFPGRPIHGYRISQLISPVVDAGQILSDYRITRYPDSFYNLKIGIPWADVQRRVDSSTVLSLCSDYVMPEKSDEYCVMGVDTGKALHAVILEPEGGDPAEDRYRLVHLGIYREFGDLDKLMKRYNVDRCVIDGLPESHAAGEFAKRHHHKVFLSFFSEGHHGDPNWDSKNNKVTLNRTDALDASRASIRNKMVRLPRRDAAVEEFARHLSCDAKQLEEDPQTGAQKYRYIKTGENHFSFAFTYAWMGTTDVTGFRAWMH
ncbi:MAG: phage terminase large subunit family protein, partial [Candidatus Polarisedimenticolia bacterium]